MAPTRNDGRSPVTRRRLLAAAGVSGAALMAGPPGAASASAGAVPDHRSWRHLFVLDRDPLFMNVGTVGSPPRQVLARLTERHREVAEQAVSGYHDTLEAHRAAVAAGLGCDTDELHIARNTTDGIGTVLAGLDLAPGDEILTTNHEHPAATTPMAILRDRRGVTVRQVALPVGDAQRAEDYPALFAAAVTARTRVLLFSAPVFRTGTMLPIRMLADLAQHHGITTVVDGAHIPGMMAYRFRELGVDFLAGSGAKWQCGPAFTGVLYLRNKVLPEYNPNPLPRFWPTVTSTQGYAASGLPARTGADVAAVLQDVGNPSYAQVDGLVAACRMWDAIGRDTIERHSVGLATALKQQIADRWGAAALYSPLGDPRLRSAITAFNPFASPADVLDPAKAAAFVARMRDEHRITVRSTVVPVAGEPAAHNPVRVSTHLFHGRDDVGRFVDAAWRLSRSMA